MRKARRARLAERIRIDFGDEASFATAFKAAAGSHFGSGWAWLTLDKGRLRIVTTPNADTPIGEDRSRRDRQELLLPDHVEHHRVLQGPLDQPVPRCGRHRQVIDDFNNDNFDHAGLGFHGGGYIGANVSNGRPITTRSVPPGTPRWGTRWKQANADWYAHAFSVSVHGSCYPHRENYLDLDPVYRDAYGVPLLRITFDFRDNELRMSEYCTRKADEIAQSLGATVVNPGRPRKGPFDARAYQTTHNTGGTPMGADPDTSAVPPRLQHWDAQNLFVVGASVYPHNSGYNPTGPLAALALRLGDDLSRFIERPRVL